LIFPIISSMWTPSSHGYSVDRFRGLFRGWIDGEKALFFARDFFIAILIIAGFWVLSRFCRYLMTKWAPRLTGLTRTVLDDRILARLTPSAELLVFFAGVYLAVRSLPLTEKMHLFASGLVFMVNVAIIANMGYRVVDELLGWYAGRVEERTGSAMGAQILPLVRKVFTIFLACAALVVILKHFNYDVLSLVTAMGIGSLAIGLAAKDTLANMISGFTLMVDRPLRIGDRIQLASGKMGDVVDIGLRSTRIRTPENTLLIIPNSELCNSTVLNMAFPDLKTQGRLQVGVAYSSDVDQVKRILVEIASEDPDVLDETPPEAFFVSFGENAVNILLIFWVSDYTKLFKVMDRVNSATLAAFAANGIEIPYPTRKVLLEREE